jgi:hypothetical protein
MMSDSHLYCCSMQWKIIPLGYVEAAFNVALISPGLQPKTDRKASQVSPSFLPARFASSLYP